MVCLRRRRCCRSMLGGVVARRVVSSIVDHRPIASSMPSRAREERRPAIWVSPRRSRHSVLARAALARSHPLPVSTPRVKLRLPSRARPTAARAAVPRRRWFVHSPLGGSCAPPPAVTTAALPRKPAPHPRGARFPLPRRLGNNTAARAPGRPGRGRRGRRRRGQRRAAVPRAALRRRRGRRRRRRCPRRRGRGGAAGTAPQPRRILGVREPSQRTVHTTTNESS